LKKNLKQILPENHYSEVIYTGTKLASKFSVKDKTKTLHCHDVIYQVSCPDPNCDATYIGETGRRLQGRILDHAERGNKSHVAKHSIDLNHDPPSYDDFQIIGSGYRSNTYKRKLSEALLIKKYRPSLNLQENSLFIEAS